MNPWKIIGWIVLGCMVLALGFCGLVAYNYSKVTDPNYRPAASSAAAPRYVAQVTSLNCDPNGGRTKADVTVRNLGPALPYAKVYVEFVDVNNRVIAANSGYIQPTEFPTQSIGDLTIYAPELMPPNTMCRLAGIQSREGTAVQIAR